ncbi:MAG: F0F1 ATP synthase subunit delta [Gammaproteobacteria bacterium]
MAEPSTVARPYAEAAFKLADGAGKLAEWSGALAELAMVAADARVQAAIADPSNPAAKSAGLVIGILSGRLSGESENFVRVLAENRRLGLLGEIREQFERLKDEREATVEAEIATAFPLDDAQLKQIVAEFERKTGRKVKATVKVDNELIGGVKVTIGDKVFDSSARAQLAALANALKL